MPYSEETHGNLLDYLRETDGGSYDNLFSGSKYYFVMKDKCLLVPRITCLRVDLSFIPDTIYFVNDDFFLESRGIGHVNMSAMGAQKGIYDPAQALKISSWSIYHLSQSALFP